MRQERTVQATIFEVFAGHEIGCELRGIWQPTFQPSARCCRRLI